MTVPFEERYKVGPEWSLCPKCKHEDNLEKCMGCTLFCGTQHIAIICGIPCGNTYPMYYHKNFEERETNK